MFPAVSVTEPIRSRPRTGPSSEEISACISWTALSTRRAQATNQTEETIAKNMLATVPAGRFAEASELGGVIAFLCTSAAGYINGVNLPVDGGRTKSL